MTALVKYEAARAALQAAHDVDEVKDIRDKAQAMAAYAKQAKDTKLVEWASEIKVRAERRAGSMLAEMKVNGARADAEDNLKSGPKYPEGTSGTTLENIGISKKQASQWQKVAAIPEKAFERAIEQTKQSAGVVTTAAVLRTAVMPARPTPATEKPSAPKTDKEASKLRAELKVEQEAHAETKEKLSDLADTARELEDKLTKFETTDPDEQQKLIGQLQKRVVRLEGEVERITKERDRLQTKCNELIRQVKIERKKRG